MLLHRLLLVATIAVSHGFVQTQNRRHGLLSPLRAWEEMTMPESLNEMGCDTELWKAFPPGAQKDILRYIETGKDDLAEARVATIKDILEYVKTPADGVYTQPTWKEGADAWQANQEAVRKEEAARAKAEKMAAAKARREAAAAKAAAEKAAAEKEAAEAAAEKESSDEEGISETENGFN